MGEKTSREMVVELLQALDRESVVSTDHDLRLALASAIPVLRMASTKLGLPTDRKAARSSYRLACAALGRDHD